MANKKIKRMYELDEWKLTQNELIDDKASLRLSESLSSLGNEYMGMRGNFEETFSGPTHQGTYVSGLWYPDRTVVGWWKIGYPDYFGKAINAVNYIGLKIWVNGNELDLFKQKPITFSKTLNMKEGVLYRNFVTSVGGIKITVSTERFISLSTKEMCAIKYSVTADKECEIEIESFIDGDIKNLDSNYGDKFWEHISSKSDEDFQEVCQIMRKNEFNIERFSIAVKSKTIFNKASIETRNVNKTQFASTIKKFKVKANETIELQKTVILVNSLNFAESKLASEADKLIKKTIKDYEELKKDHVILWDKRWEISDVKIEGSVSDQQAIRFNLFQLFNTFYGNDSRMNIGPKGFTGEKYGGATYWDTEAYCIPFYLKTAKPEVSKALLMYRFNQLDKAIENSKKLGLKGALFPMVTFNGEECHNEWEITFEEIHRNNSIAYAIYNYANFTGDKQFLLNEGLKILIEIARFWESRVHYNKIKNNYMIHGVTGPNEYENNVNNNWYTNYSTSWLLNYVVNLFEENQLDLKKFKTSDSELQRFREIAGKIYLPEDEKLGIFIQHDGFMDKELIDKNELKETDLPLNKNWSWDKILRSVYIKQADVLQGIYYFWEHFDQEEIKRNFDFYEKYTVHESSLSPCIHSIISAKLNNITKAYEFFNRTARLDLDNFNDDSDDGCHITSMTGAYLAIVEGFAGLTIRDDELFLEPRIPKEWKSFEFRTVFRGTLISCKISSKETEIKLIEGKPIKISIFDKKIKLENQITIKNGEKN